jgi:hypothetical protein
MPDRARRSTSLPTLHARKLKISSGMGESARSDHKINFIAEAPPIFSFRVSHVRKKSWLDFMSRSGR